MSGQVTMKEVANYANVSAATVSRVLNNSSPVSEEVREKVLRATEQLGYVPNSIARSLKVRSTHTIGFMASDISNTYHISVARSVEDVIQRQNYSMILCSTENDRRRELTYLELLMSKNIDGLIINSSGKNDEFILKMNKTLPIVLLNRRLMRKGFHGDIIDSSNFHGTYTLTKQLLTLGHKRIYAIHGPRHLSNGLERQEGFVKAMEEGGITVDDRYPWTYAGDFTLESGVRAIEHMCAMTERPTAILTQNNMMTLGALRALREKNIHAPEDVSLVAYDGVDNLDLMATRPTVANYNTTEMGSKAGELILERIRDNTIENREFIFQPTIIPGNAVGVPTDNLQRRIF